jgi:signal transduction histidine kinase/integral membrane sensor domain MASE1
MVPDWVPRYTPRKLILLLVVGLGYFAGGRLGLTLAISNSSITALWPPTGIAIAALLLGGFDLWPAIAVAAFCVNLSITGDVFTSLAIAVGNTIEPLLAGYLVSRFAHGRMAAQRPADVLLFALFGGLVGPLPAATIGATTLTLAGLSARAAFPVAWYTWYLGDGIGAIEFGLLILVVAAWWGNRRVVSRSGWKLEATAVGVVTVGIAALVFGRPPSAFLGGIPSIIALPPVVWAAYRFGPLGAAFSVTATSAIASVGTVLRLGTFAVNAPARALDLLQVFVVSIALTGYVVGAEAFQRGQAEASLQQVQGNLEQEVRDRTALLETAQSLAHIGSWELDLETQQVTWSDEMYRIYGRGQPHPAVTLETALEGVDPDDVHLIQGALTEVLQAPDPLHFPLVPRVYRLRRPNGEVRTLEGRARVSEVRNGRPARLVGTVQDITERVGMVTALQEREKELTRSNAELEQFAYVASHDLQEPLGVVEGYTRLVADRYAGKLDRDADAFLGYARAAAVRMRQLIDDLLQYARVPSGPRPTVPAASEQAVEGALKNLAVAIAENHAEIRVVRPLPEVYVDPAELTRVFQNLLSNAFKFHSTAPPVVEVSAKLDGAAWRFAVKDNGIGIPPEHVVRIFAIFQRLHTREEYPGTGIGLAICKKIIEHDGGRIWAESEGVTGKGSTIFFSLPLRPVS